MIFWEGVVIGLSLALVMGFGPSFFTLMQTSISRGFKSAMLLDIGILLNDIMVVCLMIMTNLQFNITDEKNLIYAGISAGIILIIFGIYTFNLSPSKIINKSENTNLSIQKMNEKFDDEPSWYIYISKGFLINIFNPFVWIFWITCVATASSNFSGDKYSMTIFFTGIFTTVMVFDIIKTAAASSLQRFFTEKMLKRLNQLTGIALILFALVIIIRVVFFPISM
ncbi:MAG: LysE family transporter [Bacteroidales bacterium]|nr:LysE family transporter [Bacteroidales bacterium]MBR5782567.1 LysE family transporter [Bacteroidales bacterium]